MKFKSATSYAIPWRRTYAEWDHTADGRWYPTTTQLEPWPYYLRRIAKRLWFNTKEVFGQ